MPDDDPALALFCLELLRMEADDVDLIFFDMAALPIGASSRRVPDISLSAPLICAMVNFFVVLPLLFFDCELLSRLLLFCALLLPPDAAFPPAFDFFFFVTTLPVS